MSKEKPLVSRTLHQLITEVNALKKQARALGIFVEDRELLSCPNCRLLEDVDTHGVLSTYVAPPELDVSASPWKATVPPDIGLRFEELAEEEYRCPRCGRVSQAESEDI